MSEKPILFSAPMVNAILAGRKTQTRRICKGARELSCAMDWPLDSCPYGRIGDRLWVRETWRTVRKFDGKSPSQIADLARAAGYEPWGPIEYCADSKRVNWQEFMPDEPGKTRVSIHMPRWASRITLAIKGVRVERLLSITEEDAKAEGVTPTGCTHPGCSPGSCASSRHRPEFALLWDGINGKRPGCSWIANPWVWVVSFVREPSRRGGEGR